MKPSVRFVAGSEHRIDRSRIVPAEKPGGFEASGEDSPE